MTETDTGDVVGESPLYGSLTNPSLFETGSQQHSMASETKRVARDQAIGGRSRSLTVPTNSQETYLLCYLS